MIHLSARPNALYVLSDARTMRRIKVKTVCGKIVSLERITCKPEHTECAKCKAKLAELASRNVTYMDIYGRDA